MTAQEITIFITLFDRRAYIEQAVASALAQTCPVQVVVVEDCGPDEGLRDFVVSRFGSRVSYHRNTRRRGLFDNWNACLELCPTPWICLLHDDDFLEPGFVETIIALAKNFPNQGLYFGNCRIVDAQGKVIEVPSEKGPNALADVDRAALFNPVVFPGALFRADYAKALGGFRRTSFFTADWDMWTKLALSYGAAETHRIVGNARSHAMEGRGTVRVERSGKVHALNLVQVKKNIALLRRHGRTARFKRSQILGEFPIGIKWLLQHGGDYSDRMLAYNTALLIQSRSPGFTHFTFKTLARCMGAPFVRLAARFYSRQN